MSYLTDRTLATGVTLQDLVHIVIPTDPSQNPAGSSYKATIQQIGDALSGASFNTFTTGGTYDNGTALITFTKNDATTYTVDLSSLDLNDTFVTGGTYNPTTDTITLTRNDAVQININGITDYYTTGGTYDNNSKLITFTRNDGNTYDVNLSTLDINDTFVTGATYNNSNTFTYTNNSGGTFDVSFDIVTGLTVNGTLSATTLDGNTILSGGTNLTTVIESLDTYVTGGTVSISATDNDNDGTIGLFYKNTDGIPRTLPFEDTFTTGGTYDNGTALITFNKNDGTSYTVNLSSLDLNDTFVTGGTYNESNDTITLTRNDAVTIEITGITDTFVTGFTYDNVNTFTISRNDGVNLTSTISTLSGVTYYGDGSGLINIPISGVTNLQTILDTKISGATNLSSEGIFAQVNGFNLEFKGITSSGGTLSITSDSNTVNLETILPQDVFVYSGNANASNSTLNFLNTTGGTFTVTNSAALFADNDINVTGGTYNPSTGCVTFTTNSGTTFDVCGFLTGFTDTYVTGTTFSSNQATLTRTDGFDVFKLSGGSNVTLSNPSTNQILIDVTIPPDTNTFVTGGTYNNVTNIITLTRNDAVTIDITGITDTYVTGATLNGNTLELERNEGLPTLTVDLSSINTNTYVTGGTYSAGTTTFTNNTGGTFNVTGSTPPLSDVLVVGNATQGSDIIMTPGDKIKNGSGSGLGFSALNLNSSFGPSGTWEIESSNGAYLANSPWIYGQPNNGTQIAYQLVNYPGEAIGIGIFPNGNPSVFTGKEIVIADNRSFSRSSGSQDKRAVFIGTRSSTINGAVTNSVLIGGVGLSATQDDTVYVDNLNINTIGGGTPVGNLGFDSNGNVVTGTTTVDTDTFVTGGTYSAGTATFTNSTGGTFNVTGFTQPFTGNTSGTCITDLYATNIYGCSPLHIDPSGVNDVYIVENGGNVGIGTTSPVDKLHVSSDSTTDIQIQSTIGSQVGLELRNTNRTWRVINNNVGQYAVSDAGVGNIFTIEPGTLVNSLRIEPAEIVINDNSGDLDFRIESTTSTNLFKVDGGNNRIGVDVINPAYKLHVSANDNTRSGYFINNTSGGGYGIEAQATHTDGGSIAGSFRATGSNIGTTGSNGINTGVKIIAGFANQQNIGVNTGVGTNLTPASGDYGIVSYVANTGNVIGTSSYGFYNANTQTEKSNKYGNYTSLSGTRANGTSYGHRIDMSDNFTTTGGIYGIYIDGASYVDPEVSFAYSIYARRGTAHFNVLNGDYDFIVDGVGYNSLLHVNAGTDRVGIGTSVPGGTLAVNNSLGDQKGVEINNTGSVTASTIYGLELNQTRTGASSFSVGGKFRTGTIGSSANNHFGSVSIVGQNNTLQGPEFGGDVGASGQVQASASSRARAGYFYNSVSTTPTWSAGVEVKLVNNQTAGGENYGIYIDNGSAVTTGTSYGSYILVDSASQTNYGQYIDVQNATTNYALLTTQGDIVFNENGANSDFRVEGDTETHLIFADASADNVGIGTNLPSGRLHVRVDSEGDEALVVDGLNSASILGKNVSITKQADATTTTTNTATAASITLAIAEKIVIEGRVIGFASGGVTVGGTFAAVAQNNGGTVSIVGTVDTSIKENSAGSPSFDVTAGTGTVDIEVTGGGEASTSWLVTYTYEIIAPPGA